MPAYTYRCRACGARFTVRMSYQDYGRQAVECPRCGGAAVQRVLSRVRVLRSEEAMLESLADPARLSALEDDPRALGKAMREMSAVLGEDLGPEFDEVVARLEKGQSPEEIEAVLPVEEGGRGGEAPAPAKEGASGDAG